MHWYHRALYTALVAERRAGFFLNGLFPNDCGYTPLLAVGVVKLFPLTAASCFFRQDPSPF